MWTKTPPTEPGWYWAVLVHNSERMSGPEAVKYTAERHLGFTFLTGSSVPRYTTEFLWWPTPITTPSEPDADE
jgi:hypothetical protein